MEDHSKHSRVNTAFPAKVMSDIYCAQGDILRLTCKAWGLYGKQQVSTISSIATDLNCSKITLSSLQQKISALKANFTQMVWN